MTQRTVKDVKIVDIQKRKLPSKHYVYVINVTWSDGSVNVIYRRYSKFFDLQTKLLEEFPEEGGVKDPTKRTLPFLPGKIIFGRSHVRDVALRRMEPISGYCKDLISLGNKVSNSSTVIKFFEPLAEDIEIPALEKDKKKKERETVEQISGPVQLDQYVAIADYRKQNSNELNMVAGDIAEVIDKNENGWWFVNLDEEQGWVPAAYLESLDGNVDEPTSQPVTSEEQFITTSAYKAELDDEMSFEIGVIVTVLEKNFDGWWLVRYQDREGWAPAMYLRKPDPSQLQALKHGCPSLKKDNAGTRATSPAAMTIPQPQQSRKEEKLETKSRKLPPRKSSVKRSLKKLPVHISNMSYEQTMVGETPIPHAAPEVEYFTVGDFRSLGIEGTLDFAEGASVDVVEKAPNGWWLGRIAGKEGWIPSSYLGKREKERKSESTASFSELRKQKPTSSDSAKAGPSASAKISEKGIRPLLGVPEQVKEEKYVTVVDYEDDSESSISFKEGEIAKLIQGDEGGWSFVRIRGKEGWAPTSYLVPLKDEGSTAPHRPKPPVGSKPSPPGRPKVLPTPGAKPFQNTAESINKPQMVASKPRTENSTKVILDKPTVSQSSILKKPDPPVRPQVKARSKPVLPVKPVRVKPSGEHPQSLCVAIASYSPEEDEGMAFSKGEEFDFLKDSGSGWWLIKRKNGEEGWAPAAYLEKRSQKPNAPERPAKPSHPKKHLQLPVYIAVAAFSDDDGDDFARFKEGDRMEVLEMDEGGWWLVKVAGKSGWAPSNFLKPCE